MTAPAPAYARTPSTSPIPPSGRTRPARGPCQRPPPPLDPLLASARCLDVAGDARAARRAPPARACARASRRIPDRRLRSRSGTRRTVAGRSPPGKAEGQEPLPVVQHRSVRLGARPGWAQPAPSLCACCFSVVQAAPQVLGVDAEHVADVLEREEPRPDRGSRSTLGILEQLPAAAVPRTRRLRYTSTASSSTAIIRRRSPSYSRPAHPIEVLRRQQRVGLEQLGDPLFGYRWRSSRSLMALSLEQHGVGDRLRAR